MKNANRPRNFISNMGYFGPAYQQLHPLCYQFYWRLSLTNRSTETTYTCHISYCMHIWWNITTFPTILHFFPLNLTFYSLPWNQSTPYGYLAEANFIILTNQIYFVFNGALLLLFVSLCLQYQAFGEIFQYLMEKFEKNSKKTQFDDHRNILCDAMNFQSSVRWWAWHIQKTQVNNYGTYFLIFHSFM